MEPKSKLIPILREGIDIVKMIFFKELKQHLLSHLGSNDVSSVGRLAGAVLNELFLGEIPENSCSFSKEERATIQSILSDVGVTCEKMRIPLTDALRTMVLCDSMEGIESSHLLAQAEELGILLKDRELPMPNKFIELTRRLGASYGILAPPEA